MARPFLSFSFLPGLIAAALAAAVPVLVPAAHAQDRGAPQLRGAFPPDTGRDAPTAI